MDWAFINGVGALHSLVLVHSSLYLVLVLGLDVLCTSWVGGRIWR